MNRLIGLVGKAGVGKDTIAAALHDRHGHERVAFADALKTAAYHSNPLVSLAGDGSPERSRLAYRLADVVDMHGWDGAKRELPDVRRYLQHYGMALREIMPGCWIDVAVDRIVGLLEAGTPVVVTDVRFADEVQAIRALGGLVARVERRQAAPLGINAGHTSEQIDALPVDAVVNNSGGLAAVPAIADSLTIAEVTL